MGSQGAIASVCQNCIVIPEKKFVLLTPQVGSVVRSRSFENVSSKNGCVVSGTGKVDLSFGFNGTI